MTESTIIEVGLDPAEAYERGKKDINFFASLAMPDVCLYALPLFYISIWQILVNRNPEQIGKILRFALGLPRGHAKTTFIKILLAWLIVYDYGKFILIICATEPLAENLLADLSDTLGSPNMEAVYGDWDSCLITDTKELKKAFYHGRSVVLAAKGAGSALRGLNIKHARPDIIFCDDMQTRENDESPAERTKLLKWMVATLFKVIAPRGDRLIIYVGNMYSEECILFKLKKNSQWISLITGAILENGEPLWPELHSLQDLMEGYYHDESLGQADLWFAEVMNDPKEAATSLLKQSPPPSPIDSDAIHYTQWDSVFLTIDPAGFRKTSDDNQIIVHGVHDGKGHVIDSIAGILKPDELIKTALQKACSYGACLIGIEAVAYQQTLAFWMSFFIRELGIDGIEVVELSPHGRSKETRLRLFIQELYSENYYVTHADTRAAYIWQMSQYKVGKKDNKDDLGDAIAYGIDIRNEYWHLLREPNALRALPADVFVVEDNTPF